MRILKIFGVSFLFIVLIMIIVALFLPGQVHVERSIIIKAEPSDIFAQINTLKNWEKWSPWHHIDPKMMLKYEGPASGKGASYAWRSGNSKVGKGTLAIINSVQDSSVFCKMEFQGMGSSHSNFRIEKQDKGTKLIWAMDSKSEDMPWLMRLPSRYFNLAMDGMVGPDFEKGLANIKTLVESTPKTATLPDVKPEDISLPATKLLMISIQCTGKELHTKYADAIQAMITYATKHHATLSGNPLGIYHHWQHDSFLFDAAIPINKVLKSFKEIKYVLRAPQHALKINYYGPCDAMTETYMAMEKWMKENNIIEKGDAWEVYVDDPESAPDKSKVLTEIYFPI